MTSFRRSGIALALLALGAGGAALGWWLWVRPAPPTDSRVSPEAPVVAPAPVAEIVVQLNGLENATVTAGTAIFLTVSLLGNTPDPGLRVGAAGRAWTTGIGFETADTQKPLPWRIDQLGRSVTLRFDGTPGDAAALGQESVEGDDVVGVEASRVHRVELGVGPEEADRIPAGTHSFRAILRRDGGPNLVSNTVTLIVEAPSAGGARTADIERTRLEAAARFYLRAEKWEDAQRMALQLVERETPDAAAFTLLGDALNGLQRDAEALAAYDEALATLPETEDEAPSYLLARMEAVQRRLEASGRRAPQ